MNTKLSMQSIFLYYGINDWYTRQEFLDLAKHHGCDAQAGSIFRPNKHGKIKKYPQRGGSVTTRLGEVIELLNETAGKPTWKLACRKSNIPVIQRGKATKKRLYEYKIQLKDPVDVSKL